MGSDCSIFSTSVLIYAATATPLRHYLFWADLAMPKSDQAAFTGQKGTAWNDWQAEQAEDIDCYRNAQKHVWIASSL